MNSKIAILIPYFGSKPDWFEYFILSCIRNQDIDWIFFSDCLSTSQKYSNLKFIDMQLYDFNALATKQLGLTISIKHPYKICDLKPAYGLIFESFIGTYDFWGYGDIDLVYGNILGLLPQYWDTEYDIISNHTDFIPGHLCILRNSYKIKNLFREAKNFDTIFQSNLYHGFDEMLHPIKVIPNHLLLTFTKRFKIQYHLTASKIISGLKKGISFSGLKMERLSFIKKPSTINDFTSVVKWSSSQGNLSTLFKTSFMSDLMLRKQGNKKWEIEWNKGKLTEISTGREIMYFHMIMAKKSNKFNIHNFVIGTKRFSITKDGIR